jgi:hypothetical protein
MQNLRTRGEKNDQGAPPVSHLIKTVSAKTRGNHMTRALNRGISLSISLSLSLGFLTD